MCGEENYRTQDLVVSPVKEIPLLANCLLQTEDYEQALDVIEITFRIIDRSIRQNPYHYNRQIDADSLIEELNQRFRESGVGYQYESGELMRVDSQFLHAEAVKPVLSLLKAKIYHSVNEEFLQAHEHYRHARYEESTTECLKALESLLKTICTNVAGLTTRKTQQKN